jgi:spore coat polysaccharide biosynthesis protein SpsF
MQTEPAARVTAIVQARMASTRLPGKSLVDVCGRPLLGRVLERIRPSTLVSQTIIATTTAPEDDAIAAFSDQSQVPCYRGSIDDVLDRFHQASKVVPTDIVVRVTADDPLKDPGVIDQAVAMLLADPALDYVSNTIVPTYPEGLDIEVFTAGALARAWADAALPSEREHVTPYIWKNPQLFAVRNFENSEDLSRLRWTVDYPEDLAFVREVYSRLSVDGRFGWRDVLKLVKDEPGLAEMNAGIVRNAGYLSSLASEVSGKR